MKLQIYQIMHVVSMVLLTGFVFSAFANPDPKGKKRTMMITGILSLLMLTGGFGMLAVMKYGWPLWVFVKLICWIALSGMAGMAYRKPESMLTWKAITIASVLIAIATVYLKTTSFE